MKRKREKWSSIVICVILISALSLVSVWAKTPSTVEFPTKTITHVEGYAVGGSNDVIARKICSIMPKYLPKQVPIVVKNITGGGGREATLYTSKSKPDGYTIEQLNIPGMLVTQIVLKTKFDLFQFVWLADTIGDTYVIAVRPDSPYKSLKDLKNAKKKIRIGNVGRGSTVHLVQTIATAEIGIPAYLIGGYQGMPQVTAAMLRGEHDVLIRNLSSTLYFFKAGDLKPLALISAERSKFLPDTPTVKELGYPSLANLKMRRPVVAPPGTPKEIADIFQEALLNTLKDEVLVKWAEESYFEITPLTGKEAREMATNVATQLIEKYKELLKKK